MSIFEKFVRVVQPWIFARRYPKLKVEVEDECRIVFEQLRSASTIVCPNHCRHEDGELLFLVSILVGQRFNFLAAREMFNSYLGLGGIVLRQLGCVEVNRGGENPEAIRAIEQQLQSDGGTVVIFPEGEIGYDNDRVEVLEPGAAAIGLDACVRLQNHHHAGDVNILPMAISYQFDDAEKVCFELATRLERELSLPSAPVSLFERAKRISTAYLLSREQLLGLSSQGEDGAATENIDERVSRLFEFSLQKFSESVDYKIPAGTERHQLHHLQARIFAKTKKASLFQKPHFEHLKNETLKLNRLKSIKSEKFDEQSSLHSLADLLCSLDVLVTGKQSTNGSQTVVVACHEPIRVRDYVEEFHKNREPTIEKVTEILRESLQSQLTKMRATHHISKALQ